MSALSEDPSVTLWRLALAGSWPSAPSRGHWWRDYVTDAYRAAREAWWLQLEDTTGLWDAEVADFVRENPPPTFKTFLVGLSAGRHRLDELAALRERCDQPEQDREGVKSA